MKIDCFGYEMTNSGCRVLKENLCERNGKCPFYKTPRRLAEEEAQAVRRLQTLNFLYRPGKRK